MFDSVRPHRRQPTRLPCPWDSLGKNTEVGCHCLLRWLLYTWPKLPPSDYLWFEVSLGGDTDIENRLMDTAGWGEGGMGGRYGQSNMETLPYVKDSHWEFAV